jgi:hypothetical protein
MCKDNFRKQSWVCTPEAEVRGSFQPTFKASLGKTAKPCSKTTKYDSFRK